LLYGCDGSLCLWAELSLPKPSLLLAQYQEFKGSALQASRTMGMGAVSALRGVSAEFQRQRTLAQAMEEIEKYFVVNPGDASEEGL
jgi:hypothetical protein